MKITSMIRPWKPKAAVGDYVLATKYSDGHAGDQWAVGIVSGYTHHQRYDVVDNTGRLFRNNGFRCVCKITPEEGEAFLKLMQTDGRYISPYLSIWPIFGNLRRRLRAESSVK